MVSGANAVALLRDGIAAARAGDKATTRRLLREVTDREPHNEVAWLWLAGVAESPRDGLDCLRQVLDINPTNDRAREGLKAALLQAGVAAAKAGRKDEARQFLHELTREDPRHELAWMWLGGIAASPCDSVPCLRRVLEINPANDRAREGLKAALLQSGVAAAKAGRKDEARQFLDELIREDPAHETAWLWLSSVADGPEKALACAHRVLEINPKSERAREEIKRLHAELAAAKPAWVCPLCFTGAEAPETICPACGAVTTLGDLDALFASPAADPTTMHRAIEYYEDALVHEPTFDSHHALGLAYANLKDWESASECFQAALKMRAADRAVRARVNAFLTRLASEGGADDDDGEKAPARRRILIVDDSPTVRKVVSLTMEKHGFEVLAAADGYEAADCLSRTVPDLILLDITMPGMDGYQVCKLIKEHPDTSVVPVVMLSGKDGFFDKIRGKLAGSTAYVTKPFNPDELLNVVEKHCLKR